ncbi:MAG: histidine--tRNA ligase [Clostridia bacterium]|nr:histidine--tRNA ligase [Clostridia bacterium]
MAYQAPKGTRDVLPRDSYRWQHLEARMRSLAARYGFQEARTPVFEQTDLFLRGVGDTTDIVQKEMYTFLDKGGRSMTLKPEGTAGLVRMFVEHKLFADTQPTKLFYLNNPVFRYERPQAGRLREHHQFGVEFFGAAEPTADAECIALIMELLTELGLGGLGVQINSIGCPRCRPAYQQALRAYFQAHFDELCDTCRTRYEKNPLRMLDCKTERCIALRQAAPSVLAYLCEDCRAHFERLKALLGGMGVDYSVTPSLVRGLDYYTKTVFEIVSDCIGAQGTVCGGGRYDGLVEQLGGPPTPAVGFGLGMERLLLMMEQSGVELERPQRCELYIASHGEAAETRAFALTSALRAAGVAAEMDHMRRSLKAQFKYADKLGAASVLTLGDEELACGRAAVKRMRDGRQSEVALDAAAIQEALRQEG